MAIGGILRSLPIRWVNHPEKMVTADYKPYQLEMARACGLETPATLLTNAPEEARSFLEQESSIRQTACLFQEEVPKQLELRITVMGERVFAAEIFSQHSPRTQVDFRQAYADLRYGVHQLPQTIHDCCLALTRALGLSFAAIDMVLTPDHRYVFLELNSSGQWAWIGQATGLPLCETLVDLLTETTHANSHEKQVEVV
jgi:glutathione synthase/RimK-type ligase-like ATP-grasp enzyme